jgi:Rrf2 family protein
VVDFIMFKINRKTEYALMVLGHLNQNNSGKTTAREVCDRFSIPFDTTSKVMQVMNNKGLLKSAQGVKGGYQLNCDLGNVSYLNLTEMIEGTPMRMDCITGSCDLAGNCNITGPVKKLNDYLSDFFGSLTIKKLLEDDNLVNLTIPQKAANEL